ncbi:MAG TPA: type II toxin-antitoxin system HipA family toxin YjjJ [Chromatiales bacterium]|nr:type II toxin-antitoxin system HipA family toxin YjjJ [Chromatiales bacterium]
MAKPTPVNDLLAQLAHGPATAGDLGASLGVSQPTVSRRLAQVRDRVVRIGQGRATRYAAARAAFGAGDSIPVYTVADNGLVSEIGRLRPLGGGYYLESGRQPWWALGESGTGWFDALPYFLEDARPQGFLGRHEANRLSRQEGYPNDPRQWSEDRVGTYLVNHGADLPGNLLFGRRALDAYQGLVHPLIRNPDSAYPELAERTLAGGPIGSSAGGEQPKFTAWARAGHVIVKFSPRRESQAGSRWADLLVAEHLAGREITKAGIPYADTALLTLGDRYYLETNRFDRAGEHGRMASFSLAAIDAEFAGLGEDWIAVAERLHAQGLLDAESHHRAVIWAATFGEWIGNTDMHLHNLSLAPGDRGFTLLPLYDMCPMGFAPRYGEIHPYHPRTPVRTLTNATIWEDAGVAAGRFWAAVATDARVSDAFRAIAQDCAAEVARVLGGNGVRFE